MSFHGHHTHGRIIVVHLPCTILCRLISCPVLYTSLTLVANWGIVRGMIIAILYYMPMIVGLLCTVYIMYKSPNERELSTVFMFVVVSVIPLVNLFFAYVILDDCKELNRYIGKV